MMTHGLDRRFAYLVLSIPGIARSTYGVIIGFGLIAASISAFVSNTATTAMLFPIGLGIMGALAGLVSDQSEGDTDVRRLRFGTALMLMIAYAASVGGLLTPIGSPPNLIGREFIEQETGTTISFFEWVVMAFPIVLIMFVLLCIILILLNRPETRQISGAEEVIAEERDKLGRFSRGERNTLFVFGLAVFLWILPDIVGIIFGDESTVYAVVYDRINEGVVAVVAAGLLFLAAVFRASYGFMLPVSTPPNAIVYGSGMIPITKMIRSGIVFDVIGVVLITFGITVMARLVGLA